MLPPKDIVRRAVKRNVRPCSTHDRNLNENRFDVTGSNAVGSEVLSRMYS